MEFVGIILKVERSLPVPKVRQFTWLWNDKSRKNWTVVINSVIRGGKTFASGENRNTLVERGVKRGLWDCRRIRRKRWGGGRVKLESYQFTLIYKLSWEGDGRVGESTREYVRMSKFVVDVRRHLGAVWGRRINYRVSYRCNLQSTLRFLFKNLRGRTAQGGVWERSHLTWDDWLCRVVRDFGLKNERDYRV